MCGQNRKMYVIECVAKTQVKTCHQNKLQIPQLQHTR